jgi:hypothetical protein
MNSGAEFFAVGNIIKDNGFNTMRGGVSIHDACNSTVANNTFGGNRDKVGVRITDSGRSDRPDTTNAIVKDNIMNLDIIKLGPGVTSTDGISVSNNN